MAFLEPVGTLELERNALTLLTLEEVRNSKRPQ